jgi:hypothetical protein
LIPSSGYNLSRPLPELQLANFQKKLYSFTMQRGNIIAIALALIVCAGLGFTALATPVFAQTSYVTSINYALEQPFGGLSKVQSWAQYIQAVYQFAIGLASIIAVVLIMLGGVRWIVAAGNESAITQAKEMIGSAVLGLVIALLSYSLLLFINPALVEQDFAIAEVPIPNADDEFWKRKWCNVTSPAFASQQCNSASSGNLQCSEVLCGDLATLELNNKTEVCRGSKCDATQPGTLTCTPKPDNPYSAASCQMQDCSQWVYSCYKKYPDSGQVDDFNTCLCGYYQNKVMPQMNAGTSPNSYTAAQLVEFAVFCGENIPQTQLVSDVITNPKGYYTPTTTSNLQNRGLNCNFGCEMYDATSVATSSTVNVSVSWDSLQSIASWLTGYPDHVVECRHS